jgi:aldose 1-epimerase
MGVVKKVFKRGDMKIQAFTLTTNTLEATILDYGATLSHLCYKTKEKSVDVVLGYDDPFDYIDSTKNPYFGAIIGRSCNRTSKGTFELNGSTYQLPINNGPNSLHGGVKGFDKQFWTAQVIDSSPFIQLELISEDMDQGYPGKIKVTITYWIENDSLKIDSQVELIDDSVKETYVNLTSHPYFNLSGGKHQTVEDHTIHMPGVKGAMELDSNQIPTGKILTAKTNPELIFEQPQPIKSKLPLVQQFRGFDHFYLAHGSPFVVITCPENRISLSVTSDCAGFQFYTGNWIEQQASKSVHSCNSYGKYSGFCIEPSQPPNSINLEEFRDTVVVSSGKPWKHWIRYQFSTAH